MIGAQGTEAPAGGLRIVYIAGAQHCGSTFLDAVLGNAPGALSLGEVGGFHRYANAQACDCRHPSASCRPCQEVVRALSAGDELSEFHRLSPLPLRERRAYWAAFGGRRRAAYARVADAVFGAAAAERGASVLIDSSKNVGRAGALAHDSSYDVRVVHLVRDGRGYLRSKRRRAAVEGRRWLPPVAMAAWLAKNLLVSAVLRRRLPPDRYLLCRYEDLMGDLDAELARLGRFTGLTVDGLAESATGGGVVRGHLFEPRRRVDYRRVVVDPSRLGSQRLAPVPNLCFWVAGGFVSACWGYDLRQSYLGPRVRAS